MDIEGEHTCEPHPNLDVPCLNAYNIQGEENYKYFMLKEVHYSPPFFALPSLQTKPAPKVLEVDKLAN